MGLVSVHFLRKEESRLKIFKGFVFSFSVLFLIFGSGFFRCSSPFFEKSSFCRIDGGKTFVEQRGFCLFFSDYTRPLSRKIELSSGSVKNPGKCLFYGNRVFLPDRDIFIGFSEKGEAFLFCGAVFDRNGNIVFEFPPAEEFYGSLKILPEKIFLFGEEKLVFVFDNLSFVFDTESGTCEARVPLFALLFAAIFDIPLILALCFCIIKKVFIFIKQFLFGEVIFENDFRKTRCFKIQKDL